MTFISPMLPEKCDKPFDDGRYVFEPKIDGHRLFLSHINGQTHLFTRFNNECSRQYPELLRVPTDHDVILDGEVACLDERGAVCFESVMERFRMTKHMKIQYAYSTVPVHYFVFDILECDGKDLRKLPLIERKAILDEVLENNAYFSKSKYVEGRGKSLFESIKTLSMEGAVAKRKDSVYIGRRSDNWLKLINYQYADVYIAGYRKRLFGWLVAVEAGDGHIRPAGIIELKVPSTHMKAFYSLSKTIETGEDRNFVYIQPQLKARVKFRNWTKNGMLRSPAFVDFVI